MNPKISVILPAFNAENTIARAIESVLCQTFDDFELIIINDGSKDSTLSIISGYTERRIRIINQANAGLSASLNRGILQARGTYIARMDADDEALPKRFERQLEFLDSHPTVAAVGTASRVVYSDGTSGIRMRPLDKASIRRNIVLMNPFTHSSVMMRKSVVEEIGLYDTEKDSSKRLLVEDYDLWVRMLSKGYDLANLPDVLMVYYREKASILRKRSLNNRLKQQILSRVDVIQRLQLSKPHYLQIVPVCLLSVLSYCGLRLDPVFTFLCRRRGGGFWRTRRK